MKEPLMIVRLISARHTSVAALTHVQNKIETFLFEADLCRWSLESASERGFVRLLDRLLACEWPGFNTFFRHRRTEFAIERAIDATKYDVLEWWLKTYMPDQTQTQMEKICQDAVEQGNIPLLKWLHDQSDHGLPYLHGNAIYCSSPDTVYWLHENGGRHMKLELFIEFKDEAVVGVAKWCLEHEDKQFLTIRNPEKVVAGAVKFGRLDALQWLHDHRSERCGPKSIMIAVCHGHLHVAKWLQETYPKHYFAGLGWKHTRIEDIGHLNLEVIRWGVIDFNRKGESAQLSFPTML